MKRFLALLFLMLALAACLAACARQSDGQPEAGNPEKTAESGKRILVAYFSATGTTRTIAELAASAMNADIYEIVPAQMYTSNDLNYNDRSTRATKEMNDPACRPEIGSAAADIAGYDVIFIGFPIWWGEAPRILSTFVESYDFTGKTVVTFCTSGSSGMNDRGIKALASGANWITGARIKSGATRADVAKWIGGLGLGIAAE